ncbi:MAG: chromosome segregation protein SMC, partial [Methylocapsa sp.]|nr:chromosome segregation protein SMC [Methylocapsa sp.]
MKLTKLRITGFKTFVEPSEFLIEPGLTGIIGPNGCGKSNLVEALRWVMGESSSKSMRASGMEDVIFSGGGERPARNMAEVALFLDNRDRSAPAAFNDAEAIEVSRHIAREAGSTYRINGREARARDVQLLFADASTGARSPAMVRQGQIGEIIAAKPQERRRILEEAAGISGLHSRRHEAELRLKAAEDNLARLNDVVQQLNTQTESLQRQARQAERYRGLAAEIKRNEALLALINQTEAARALEIAQAKLDADLMRVAEKTRAQAEVARNQAFAAQELPGLRAAEAEANSDLQKLILARETLDGEERRARGRIAELERRAAQIASDIAREQALTEDAAGVLARLDAEAAELSGAGSREEEIEELRGGLAQAEAVLAESERKLAECQDVKAALEARRAALEAAIEEEMHRLGRLDGDLNEVRREQTAILAGRAPETDLDALQAELGAALAAAELRESEAAAAEFALAEARKEEAGIRAPAREAESRAQKLETQVETLSKVLTAGTGGFWPPVTDEITVAKGYEAALGAALGDDLEASTNPASPAHWAETEGPDDPALPPRVEALLKLVSAPSALARRLNQIGVVLRSEGASLRALLRPGQRLVSKEGDLWRWDGFTQAAEAPTAAARRLAEKNRLGELEFEAQAARVEANDLKLAAERAGATLASAASAEQAARQAHKNALRWIDAAREAKTAAEQRKAETAARLSALDEALARLNAARAEASGKLAQAEADLARLREAASLATQLNAARMAAAEDRGAAAEASAKLQNYEREAARFAKRIRSLEEERQSWLARARDAQSQIEALKERQTETAQELQKLEEAPALFAAARRDLMNKIETAEEARRETGDSRAAAEARVSEADKAARGALEAMSTAREEMARSEARVEAARARCNDIAHMIATELGCTDAGLSELAHVAPGKELPEAEKVEKRLENLKSDRERLGSVNLRAEEELSEVLASKTKLTAEFDDLTEAIRRLRLAIQNLNKEGRERLLSSFDTVQTHFKELFTTLFGGGSAELQLIESEDPLEAGLEILVHPPGKKPHVMTLLSGGEQALTALSLIFAIFLTNPAPVCVLDEVDAPLDDANVARFCDLLDNMRERTETRFITVTHNPITMARMNRLYGVTMA